ncbi:MAG TPA: ABC transporter substrate-binding protein [Rubrobacteraceae bacterium]|nr:ABC transporter substrate-binding protein [Rubrobacteraceae bacterium]
MTERQERRPETLSGRRINRRDFLKIGGAGLAGAALLGVAGCGGGGGGGSSGGSGDIVFAMGPDTSGSLQKLIDKFNKENKGKYSVKYRKMPTDTGQFFDKIRTQFQSGGGDIDVIGGDVIWPAQFAANGWISDVSDKLSDSERSKFLDGPIASMTYQGKLYGIPWYTDAGMLYYRKDLLQKSGFNEAPKTWDELKSMAKKVVQDSGTKAGFVWQGSQYEGGVVDGLEYINSYGGKVLDPSDASKVVIDSPDSVKGLAMAASMIPDGVSPQAVTNYTEQESQTAFLNGEAVFCRNWPYMYALVGNPDESKIKTDQVSVAPLPAGSAGSVSGLGGWNFYINAASQKQDAAIAFAKFMADPEQQKYRALNGSFLPTLKSLYDDKEILDAVPVIALAGEALANTVPRPVSPAYSDMSLKMAEQFNKAFKGDVSPEDALKTLQTDLQQIADQAS